MKSYNFRMLYYMIATKRLHLRHLQQNVEDYKNRQYNILNHQHHNKEKEDIVPKKTENEKKAKKSKKEELNKHLASCIKLKLKLKQQFLCLKEIPIIDEKNILENLNIN